MKAVSHIGMGSGWRVSGVELTFGAAAIISAACVDSLPRSLTVKGTRFTGMHLLLPSGERLYVPLS